MVTTSAGAEAGRIKYYPYGATRSTSGTLSTVGGVPTSIAMGDQALWFGADMTSHPGEVASWVEPSGYGNGWSQRLTSPEFSVADHPGAVLRFDASLYLAHLTPLQAPDGANAFLEVQALDQSGYHISPERSEDSRGRGNTK